MDDSDWEIELPEDYDEYGTVPCPHCGADIHEDTPRCPICGDYVTGSSSPFWSTRPAWYTLLAILGMTAVVTACLFAF